MTSLKIVVTGASGFIGSHVSSTLAESYPHFSIIGIGRKKNPLRKNDLPNYDYIECDLLDRDRIHEVLPGRIDILIHLAGDRRTFVKPDEYSQQAISNIMMTLNMADYAFSAKAKLFIYSSSVYVYSGNSGTPFRESSIDIPCENLGATKLASELILKSRAVAGQFKAISFRIGTVYGPGASPEQFINQAIMKLSSSVSIAKFGVGNVKRDFVFVDDVANAFTAAVSVLLEKDFNYEALNVGTGKAVSIREVVKILSDELGTEKKIEFSIPAGTGNKADTDHQLDLTRIRSVLGWEPEYSLADGLRQTIISFS